MNVGYVRVSSKEQNTDRQTDLMESLGVERIYIEKISGKNTNRPELQKMISYLREGDVLIVESISRLARNTKDLLDITETLESKGIKFVSKKESIDTATPSGKFMLTLFGAIAELERSYIRERQSEGIAAAMRRGKKFGRPKLEKPENWDMVYEKWRCGEIKAVAAMKILGVSKTRFYALVREMERRG